MSDKDRKKQSPLRLTVSEPWEIDANWTVVVCEPVLRYPMAPREAKMILEAAGELMADGVGAEELIKAMMAVRNDTSNPR